jgi:hypothetical protein
LGFVAESPWDSRNATLEAAQTDMRHGSPSGSGDSGLHKEFEKKNQACYPSVNIHDKNHAAHSPV